METGISVTTALLVLLWILWPLAGGISRTLADDEGQEELSLEERYTRALLDLESDLLGGRITDAEFNRRRESLARSLGAQRG